MSWAGLPAFYDDFSLVDWPRGFNFGADWTYTDTQRTEAFASLEHVFEMREGTWIPPRPPR
mgnify:CR=1 FL=1